jgi:hypothetical protein
MNFELSEDEKIALAAELKRTISEDRYPAVAAYPHSARDTQQARASAGPQTLAAAEGVCAAPSRSMATGGG